VETNKMVEILEKKAIDSARYQLQEAAKMYNRAIGLSCTAESIKLKNKTDGTEIIISTSNIFREITDQLIIKRTDGIKTEAIKDFLNKFDNFQQHIDALQNYEE